MFTRLYRLLGVALAALLIAGALPVLPAPTASVAAQGACGTAPTPRLSVGMEARVTIGDGTGNNLRDTPATQATVLGVMAEGEVFSVLAGPQCIENYYWWQVRRWDGQTGWTAEGAANDYWLEPWPVANARLASTSERPALANVLIAYRSASLVDQQALPYVMDAQTGATAQPGAVVVPDGVLRWSPDGTHLAVSDGTDIYLLQPDGTPLVNVTLSPGSHETNPTWSPDGTRIAFVSDRDGNSEIYWQTVGTTIPVRLTTSPSIDRAPVWSPDGTRIAFVSDRDGVAAVYVMSAADGANPVRVTTGPAASAPIWSPDSRQIAFVSGQDAATATLAVINADGSGLITLTQPQNVRYAVWSPDGKRIAFAADNPLIPGSDALFSVRPDGTDLLQYTVAAGGVAGVAWSPDGQWIAYGYTQQVGGAHDIAAIRASGINQVVLTASPSFDDTFPVWQPVPGGVLANATPGATVVNPASQDLLLIYDAATPVFTLQNVSGQPLNLTGLSFIGNNLTVSATLWADYTASPLDSFKPIGCLMLWPYSVSEQPAPAECGDARQGWITRNGITFWTAGSFTVTYNGVAVATCQTAAERCAIDLP